MPTSSQPQAKLRPYESIIKQKVRTDQGVQIRNAKEITKMNRITRQMDIDHKLAVHHLWQKQDRLRAEIAEQSNKIQTIRMNLHLQSKTDPLATDRPRTSRSSSRRNQIEIPVEAEPVSNTSQSIDPSPSDDIFNKHEKLLRQQREANKDVSKWVAKFLSEPIPTGIEEEQTKNIYDLFY